MTAAKSGSGSLMQTRVQTDDRVAQVSFVSGLASLTCSFISRI